MKLRMQGQSLRLRLRPAEVEALAERGRVDERIVFGPEPNEALTYALEVDEAAASLTLRHAPGSLTVLVPLEQAAVWASSDQVGFEGEVDVGDEEPLRLLVEKDWQCLEPRPGEDESDLYPHPNA
ncbi:MAG: hypothetical protein AAGN46_04225 [Acidobacteriota bacterium]